MGGGILKWYSLEKSLAIPQNIKQSYQKTQ